MKNNKFVGWRKCVANVFNIYTSTEHVINIVQYDHFIILIEMHILFLPTTQLVLALSNDNSVAPKLSDARVGAGLFFCKLMCICGTYD